MADAANRQILGARFPLYYGQEEQFLQNGQPSGLAGATARLAFQLNNWPQTLYRLSVCIRFELQDAYVAANPGAYRDLAYIADDVSVRMQASQQNWTSDPIDLRTIQGDPTGAVWQPLPAGYIMRGGNQITLDLTARTNMPDLGDFVPIRVARATLVAVVTQSDAMPGSAPGSSGWP
jgi:hypothetical protein